MARTLETLNQITPPATSATVGPKLPDRISPPEPDAVEPPEFPDEPMPFIEVGPRRLIEGSPGVLAQPGPVRPAPVSCSPAALTSPPPRLVPALNPSLHLAPEPTDLPASVVFRPAQDRPVRGQPTFAPELIAYHAAGQSGGAPYRELLDQLLRSSRSGKRQVLFFTAGRSEAGTTTVLLNLAITAALQGRSILVVDANLRRPGVAARLGLGDVPGLREVLAGHFPPEDVVRPTGLPNLKALTSGPLAGPARLTIAPEKVRDLLAECRQNHELVFVDGSRWDGRPDVTTFGSAADAVYLVVAAHEVDTPAIEGLTQLIPEQGGSLAGSILIGR
jgi:Mrp family chromosome partitioning ATPase